MPSPGGERTCSSNGRGPGETLFADPSKRVIESMVVGERFGLESAVRLGLEQTASYTDLSGAESGHLVVFDMRPGPRWDERIETNDAETGGPRVTLWVIYTTAAV